MADDPVKAVLAEKREMLAEAMQDANVPLEKMTYRCGLAAGDAHGALQALEAVLELAGNAEVKSWGAVGKGPFSPNAWTLDPDEVRAVIARELGTAEAGRDSGLTAPEYGVGFTATRQRCEMPLPSEDEARATVEIMREDRPGWDAALLVREAARPAGPWIVVPDEEAGRG